LVTLSVLQVVLGFDDQARGVRYAKAHLRDLFPYVPGQSGYNKRLPKAASMPRSVMRAPATDIDAWADDTWLTDSTPVECGRSRPTAKHSNLAGWAGYGYCASHSPQGVATRVIQRLFALAAAIWHNHHSGQPLRSLTAFDH
jgi:hypothetical protein